ncbi:Tetratricopeptide repeat-containing protein [Jannaschia faecimaris]|uniref:Tetratricopeptide repeat-containing protein n=1 Tax=Jannaschia faecimaris TaxID=1244108 RepID=A0A1H3L3Y7_9RHOB|nr:tetratricopeptide repeat protein [Jannaschia faecimaris]SDY58966.1 Tetratricopeptide repeat-containing protein [Jannaschia faecimaris]
MIERLLALLIAGTVLSACQSGIAGRSAVTDDPLTAPGFARGDDVVDPLIVGDRLLAAGEAELALDSYVRAAAGSGLTPEIKGAMAGANIKLGRLGQAERLLRDVVAVEPRNGEAWNNLGVALLEQGKHGEALRVFETAFALQPSPEILDNLRIAGAKIENGGYGSQKDGAFTLTRRINGVYDLNAPDGQFP